MFPEELSRVVAASVVPVVVISAGGLLCLAFYIRLAAVVSRLRTFHRERLAEQEAFDRHAADATSDPAASEAADRHAKVLDGLEEQSARVARRARLLRATLRCLLSAIACMARCSLFCWLGVLLAPVLLLAAPAFVAGMLLLVLAVCFVLAELRRSLDPVELESRLVASLTGDDEDVAAGGGVAEWARGGRIGAEG